MRYDLASCNIKSCRNPTFNLFLCKKHYTRYIIDPKILSIQSRVYRRALGKGSVWDHTIWFGHLLLHHLLSFRVYYFEHFPLETVFLYHRRRFSDRANNKQPSSESDRLARQLTQFYADFGIPENQSEQEIRDIVIRIEGDFKKTDYDRVRFSGFFQKHTLFRTKTFVVMLAIAITLSLTGLVLSRMRDFKLVILHETNVLWLVVIAMVVGSWIALGMKYLYSIDGVVQSAINGTLYADQRSNERFLQMIHGTRAHMTTREENYASNFGTVAFVAAMAIYALFSNGLSAIEFAVSFLLTSLFLILFYVCTISNLLLIGATSILWKMETKGFQVDIFKIDGSCGVDSLVTMGTSFLKFGIVAYFLILAPVWYFFPTATTLGKIGLFLLFQFGFIYFRGTKQVLRIYKSVRHDIQKTKILEIEKLSKRHAKGNDVAMYSFLKNVKFRPIKLDKVARFAMYVFTTVIIPVLILYVDKNSDVFVSAVDWLISLLTPK